jgi:hypothetical protein
LQKDPPRAVKLRQEDYIERALESVRNNLEYRKKSADQVQIELIGEPIVRPDRAAHLSKVNSNKHVAVDIAPDALVLVKIREHGQFRSPALVSFIDQQAEVRFYDADPLRYPMDESEWSQVAKELEPFYSVASEIDRGPERFDPFLQELLRTMGEQSALNSSSNDTGKIPGLMLDCYTLMNWLRFEGLEPDDSFLKRAQKYDPGKAVNEAVKGFKEWRKALKISGALEPDHLRSASAFIRRSLGEGLLYKESNNNHQYRGVAESAVLYSALLIGRIGCHVHFSRIDGQLRIVGIAGGPQWIRNITAGQKAVSQTRPSIKRGRPKNFEGTVKTLTAPTAMSADNISKPGYFLLYLTEYEDAVFYIRDEVAKFTNLRPGQWVSLECFQEKITAGQKSSKLKGYFVGIVGTKERSDSLRTGGTKASF